MGFHAVALGVVINHHNISIEVFLKLIAKEIYINDILINHNDIKKTIDNYIDNENEDEENNNKIRIVLYDDIRYKGRNEIKINIDEDLLFELCNYSKFTYSYDESIKIGMPHICTYMLYLGCVGDDLGGGKNCVIKPETITTLMNWINNTLIPLNRLPNKEYNIEMIGNCCS